MESKQLGLFDDYEIEQIDGSVSPKVQVMAIGRRAAPIPPDFEAIERQENQRNLRSMEREISRRSPRVRKRIQHFSSQFGVSEADFWRDLDANARGPLAAVLAKEARRQNIHENAAADYIKALESVSQFQKLKANGPDALYLNAEGRLVTGRSLGRAPKPSKSIDFQWRTGQITCYAAQKYTKEVGGNQDNQFNELERLLQDFQNCRSDRIAFFVLVDGPYYTDTRIRQLRRLVRTEIPRSYVTGVAGIANVLAGVAAV